jgi:hypothetical protein
MFVTCFCSEDELSKKRIFWEDPKKAAVKGCVLNYDGTPFVINGTVIFNCTYGKDKHISRKKKQLQTKANEVSFNFIKRSSSSS